MAELHRTQAALAEVRRAQVDALNPLPQLPEMARRLQAHAAALRARGSQAQVVGVEPTLAADAGASFAAGRVISWPSEDVVRTVADGVRTQALGHHNFEVIQKSVDAFVDVPEEAILDAAAWYLRDAHLAVEPTGGLTLAAYRMMRAGTTAVKLRPGPTVLLVSGGNTDSSMLAALAQRPS